MENNIKNAAIYLRVSAEEKELTDSRGLKVQEDKLREYCKSHNLNLANEHVYVDDGYSGSTSVNERPELHRLIKDAGQGKFQVLVVYRVDRLFNNLREILSTVSSLLDYGVSFHSGTEAFDSQTASGRLMLQMVGCFAELERNNVREKAKHECPTCGRLYEPVC